MPELGKFIKEFKNYSPSFLPTLAPFFVLLLGWWIFLELSSVNLSTYAPEYESRKIAGKEAMSRYLVGISFILLVCVSFGVFLFSVVSVFRRENLIRFCCYMLISSFLFCVSFFFVLKIRELVIGDSEFVDLMGRIVFEKTIDVYPEQYLPLLKCLNMVGYILPIFTCSFLFSAYCTLVPNRARIAHLNPEKLDHPEREEAVLKISDHIKWVRYYLAAAALLLLSGLIYMNEWRKWPLAYWTTSTDDMTQFALVAKSTLIFQSGHFTLIIFSIFLPVAISLKKEAGGLADLEPREFEVTVTSQRRKWMQEQGLTLSNVQIIQQVIAILSPFLVPVLEGLSAQIP